VYFVIRITMLVEEITYLDTSKIVEAKHTAEVLKPRSFYRTFIGARQNYIDGYYGEKRSYVEDESVVKHRANYHAFGQVFHTDVFNNRKLTSEKKIKRAVRKFSKKIFRIFPGIEVDAREWFDANNDNFLDGPLLRFGISEFGRRLEIREQFLKSQEKVADLG